MRYYKTDNNGIITDVVDTTDAEWAEHEGYRNDKEVVQVYDGSFKFADETTEDDFKPPLSIVKENKISELKVVRDFKEGEPSQTDKGLFDYDDKARDRIQAAIIALNAGGRIDWTLTDNTNVTVTNLDLEDVVRAVAVRSNTLHVTYRQLKEQVMAAETNEEVEAIHWPEA